jgi:hypothetical protein
MKKEDVLYGWLESKEKEILQRLDKEVMTTQDMLVLILKAHLEKSVETAISDSQINKTATSSSASTYLECHPPDSQGLSCL